MVRLPETFRNQLVAKLHDERIFVSISSTAVVGDCSGVSLGCDPWTLGPLGNYERVWHYLELLRVVGSSLVGSSYRLYDSGAR